MSTVFTDTFRTALRADLTIMTNANIVMWLFRGAPGFSNGDTRYTPMDTIAKLQVMPGWSAPVSVPSAAMSVGTRDIVSTNVATGTTTTSRYVMANNPFDIPANFPDSQVNVVAFVFQGSLGGVTNPIIFISNGPFPEPEHFTNVDSIVARPDASITTGDNRWLFGWSMPAAGQPVLPVEGPIAVLKGPPPFEASHTQHVWLYPQRVNMVANPSFETLAGNNHWRGSGSVTKIESAAPGGGKHAGQFSGPLSGYLNPLLGTVTTPDPGVLPAECTFIYKVRGPTIAGSPTNHVIVSKYQADPQRSWYFGRTEAAGTTLWAVSPDGLSGSVVTFSMTTGVPTTTDETWALSVSLSGATQVLTSYRLVDGVWTVAGTRSDARVLPFNGASIMSIGRIATAGSIFDGRIYSVEMRSGLDPAAGTVAWRFDANDYPGTGTSYTDPRGRQWTLDAGAIVPKVGDVTKPTRFIAESNYFPIDMGKTLTGKWTIQAMVKGTGYVRVGLVYWNKTFDEVGCDWGDDTEVWPLPADGWLHLYALRQTVEASRGQVRIEVEGGDLVLDNMLAEPDWLLDWPYFDGDTTYGARDDFSWYGTPGKSYSMWYNNRGAVVGRLFAWEISAEDQTITDEEVEAQGFVYGWVPAGTRVTPHLDVLYPGDIQEEVPDVMGTAITRYQTDPGDSQGIPDPW